MFLIYKNTSEKLPSIVEKKKSRQPRNQSFTPFFLPAWLWEHYYFSSFCTEKFCCRYCEWVKLEEWSGFVLGWITYGVVRWTADEPFWWVKTSQVSFSCSWCSALFIGSSSLLVRKTLKPTMFKTMEIIFWGKGALIKTCWLRHIKRRSSFGSMRNKRKKAFGELRSQAVIKAHLDCSCARQRWGYPSACLQGLIGRNKTRKERLSGVGPRTKSGRWFGINSLNSSGRSRKELCDIFSSVQSTRPRPVVVSLADKVVEMLQLWWGRHGLMRRIQSYTLPIKTTVSFRIAPCPIPAYLLRVLRGATNCP